MAIKKDKLKIEESQDMDEVTLETMSEESLVEKNAIIEEVEYSVKIEEYAMSIGENIAYVAAIKGLSEEFYLAKKPNEWKRIFELFKKKPTGIAWNDYVKISGRKN